MPMLAGPISTSPNVSSLGASHAFSRVRGADLLPFLLSITKGELPCLQSLSRRMATRTIALLAPLLIATTPLSAFPGGSPTMEDRLHSQGSGILQTLQNYGYDIVMPIAVLMLASMFILRRPRMAALAVVPAAGHGARLPCRNRRLRDDRCIVSVDQDVMWGAVRGVLPDRVHESGDDLVLCLVDRGALKSSPEQHYGIDQGVTAYDNRTGKDTVMLGSARAVSMRPPGRRMSVFDASHFKRWFTLPNRALSAVPAGP